MMSVSSVPGVIAASTVALPARGNAASATEELVGALLDPALLGTARAAALATYFTAGSNATIAVAAAQFAAASGADPVNRGRTEAAAFEFAQEARILAVGAIDRSPTELAATITAALDAGASHAAGGVALDLADMLHHATERLSATAVAPLIPEEH